VISKFSLPKSLAQIMGALGVTICVALPASATDVVLRSEKVRGTLDEASLLRALDDDAAPQDYVAAARADYRRLLTALYAQGYYGGSVSITIDGVEAANIAPLGAPSVIDRIVIAVDAGSRFRFSDVQIGPLPPDTTLDVNLGPREFALSGTITDAVRDASQSWRERGHAKVSVADQSIVARHGDRALDVTVTLDPGPRLTFGQLIPTGNSIVTDERMREIAGLPTGEVYSPAAIAKSEQRLRRTGTFDSVSLTEADAIGPNNTLDIDALVSRAKIRRLGFGAEVSSIEGLTLSTFWLHRNFLRGAERFRADIEVSGISGETGGTDYRVGATFTRPATLGPDTDYFLSGNIAREDEPEYLLDSVAFETGFSRILTDDLTVRAGVGVLFAREETDIETREYTLLTMPLDATLDRRDVPNNAKEGYYIDVNATPFISTDGEIAGGRVFGDLRGYLSFGEDKGLTFAGRGQVGSVIGASGTQAPADFLFYSGGGGTVRGQPYQSLGIDRVENGEAVVTGGTSFTGAQLEARYLVREKLSLVGFYDFGHVGDTETPLEDGDWHAGAGFGIRYDTGIGPIRLDLGTQASGDVASGLQVYIGIGQSF